ncbi:GPW/gp25 family protein [Kutzneria sp. CA-103260]|uniref:GPW/gp25 family protein n=1 Tax=Kutzneria sp. CA-103260 TaxID=2802641 RepID=UPI001BEE54D3|nr:GPW/gp25 family protein [Kutzneria sp. CA-103260]QUQ65634.1 phage baseplate lysozyme [Kutzneria sp. CA-103260]
MTDPAFLGTGLAFPVRPDPTRALPTASGAEKVRQSIWLILATAPGERRMRPDFGCGIHDLVFQANTQALHTTVTERVRTALLTWEPRIDVLDVTVEAPADATNFLLIRISYRIRANNTADNLVYPFFLTEGTGG